MRPVILLLLPLVTAHICMLRPVQRGGFDVSDPGDITCFQPSGPCGTVKPKTPSITLVAGTTFNLLWQQNLNHYNPGYPGFFDVSWAVGQGTSESDFTVLAQIPDFWSHNQASQTNFTLPITVPSTTCSWCTLRVRYHPNKPTEPVFHQCADVAIVPWAYTSPLKIGSYFSLVQPSSYLGAGSLVQIDENGEFTQLNVDGQVFSKRSIRGSFFVGGEETYFAEGVVAVDSVNQLIYYLGDSVQSWQQAMPPRNLYVYDIAGNKMSLVSQLANPGTSWTSFISISNNSKYALLAINQDATNGGYTLYGISSTGQVSAPLGTTVGNFTYVNFFWADVDSQGGIVYALAGDENNPFTLPAVLYVFDINSQMASSVQVDNSKFTISSFSVDRISGNLYSYSPGLYGSDSGFTLVQIDPKSGKVTPVQALSERFVPSWAGSVYGPSCGWTHHLFKQKDGDSNQLIVGNLADPAHYWSTGLQTGVDQGLSLHTVVFVPNPSNPCF